MGTAVPSVFEYLELDCVAIDQNKYNKPLLLSTLKCIPNVQHKVSFLKHIPTHNLTSCSYYQLYTEYKWSGYINNIPALIVQHMQSLIPIHYVYHRSTLLL